MISWLRLGGVVTVALSASAAVTAGAQDYPVRPIRIVTSEIGAGGEKFARGAPECQRPAPDEAPLGPRDQFPSAASSAVGAVSFNRSATR